MKLISSLLSQKSLLLLALAAVTMLFSGCYVEERRVVNRGYYGRDYDRGYRSGYGYNRGYSRSPGYYGRGSGYRSTTVVRDRDVYIAPRRTAYVARPSRTVVVGRSDVVNRRNVTVVNGRRDGDRDRRSRSYDRDRRD